MRGRAGADATDGARGRARQRALAAQAAGHATRSAWHRSCSPRWDARQAMGTVRSRNHFAPRVCAESTTPYGPQKHDAGRMIVEGAHDWTG